VRVTFRRPRPASERDEDVVRQNLDRMLELYAEPGEPQADGPPAAEGPG
jgi:hypothetical protein